MSVTSHMKAFMIETMRTRESRIIFVDNLFLKESQCLRRLEGGARRISSHDGTVQQRLPLVHLQQAVVLSPLAPYHQMRVKGRRGNHAQNLTRSRFDGHNGTNFVLKQPFAQHLEVNVDA